MCKVQVAPRNRVTQLLLDCGALATDNRSFILLQHKKGTYK